MAFPVVRVGTFLSRRLLPARTAAVAGHLLRGGDMCYSVNAGTGPDGSHPLIHSDTGDWNWRLKAEHCVDH